jgi:hypothetical protein
MFFLQYDPETGKPSALYNSIDGNVPEDNIIPIRNEQYTELLENPNVYKVEDGVLNRNTDSVVTLKHVRPTLVVKDVHVLLSPKHLDITRLDVISDRVRVRLPTYTDKVVWLEVTQEFARTVLNHVADHYYNKLGDK